MRGCVAENYMKTIELKKKTWAFNELINFGDNFC